MKLRDTHSPERHQLHELRQVLFLQKTGSQAESAAPPVLPKTGPCHVQLPRGSAVENLPAVQEILGGSLGWVDPLEEEMTTPLQYSCLGKSKDRGAWRAKVHGVTESNMTEK